MMDGWMDEWMHGWMDAWMDGWTDAAHVHCPQNKQTGATCVKEASSFINIVFVVLVEFDFQGWREKVDPRAKGNHSIDDHQRTHR